MNFDTIKRFAVDAVRHMGLSALAAGSDQVVRTLVNEKIKKHLRSKDNQQ